MKLLLDKETLNSKVIIPDSAEFEAITSNVEAQYRPFISQLATCMIIRSLIIITSKYLI